MLLKMLTPKSSVFFQIWLPKYATWKIRGEEGGWAATFQHPYVKGLEHNTFQ